MVDHLDIGSQDLFARYRTIAGKLKKRFLKKPNVRGASEEYGKLANALKNEDNHQYAALCFAAMAECDQIMGDTPGQAEAWANAGRQFLQAEEVLFSAVHASYEESLEAGIQCFLLAMDALEKQSNETLAAIFSLEIAHKLKHFKKFHEALRFFQRAADLQSQKPECQLQALEEVVSCKIELREYDGALGVLTRIVHDAQDKEGPFILLRQRCEVSQLLLLLILQIPPRHMKVDHVNLLKKYSSDVLDIDILGFEMNVDLYILLQSLIVAVQKKNYKEIETIQPQLRVLLEPVQQHLLHLLVDLYCPYSHTLL